MNNDNDSSDSTLKKMIATEVQRSERIMADMTALNAKSEDELTPEEQRRMAEHRVDLLNSALKARVVFANMQSMLLEIRAEDARVDAEIQKLYDEAGSGKEEEESESETESESASEEDGN